MKQTRSLSEFSCLSEYNRLYSSLFQTGLTLTLVNVYVALPVFTRIAGTSYAYFME